MYKQLQTGEQKNATRRSRGDCENNKNQEQETRNKKESKYGTRVRTGSGIVRMYDNEMNGIVLDALALGTGQKETDGTAQWQELCTIINNDYNKGGQQKR